MVTGQADVRQDLGMRLGRRIIGSLSPLLIQALISTSATNFKQFAGIIVATS